MCKKPKIKNNVKKWIYYILIILVHCTVQRDSKLKHANAERVHSFEVFHVIHILLTLASNNRQILFYD